MHQSVCFGKRVSINQSINQHINQSSQSINQVRMTSGGVNNNRLAVLLLLLLGAIDNDVVTAFTPAALPLTTRCFGLLPSTTTTTSTSTATSTNLYMAKSKKRKKGSGGSTKKNGSSNNKLSYAERLQLKKKQEQAAVVVEPTVPVEDGFEEKQLAKQMIAAQRESVDMLTFIRQRVEGLPLPAIMEALGDNVDNVDNNYIVIDDFLANDGVLTTLQQEAGALFQTMETDLSRLGSGEFLVPIKGGDEQYGTCPRTIEMVVSTTKHLAGCLSSSLDPQNCMATLRTHDSNSRLASLSLVEGGELPPLPFDTIVGSDDNDTDKRKVTMLYYPTDCNTNGGGIVVENQDNDDITISAKRDRLILLRSDTCRHRMSYFDEQNVEESSSCLELHLVTKPSPQLLD